MAHEDQNESERAEALGKLITEWRRAAGLQRPEVLTELSKHGLKLSYSHLQKMEKGERSLASASVEIREGLRRLYRISRKNWTAQTGLYTPDPSIFKDEATFDRDLALGSRMIPEYDMLKAGPGGWGGDIVGYIDYPANVPGEFVGYRIHGDSMNPSISDGDTVVIRVQDYASARNTIVCWTPEDGMMCKYLKEVTPDGTHILTSYNATYPPIWAEDIKIYGVVVQIRKNIQVINGNH